MQTARSNHAFKSSDDSRSQKIEEDHVGIVMFAKTLHQEPVQGV